MYNVVPSGGLTCLFAKATFDESNLYHRRLGHINFKTMNKLIKGNLVRGLPSKIFKNNHTCVACQKGKQHKASWIEREFSVARTQQQNRVAERKNRTLIEAARTMLADSLLPIPFWTEADEGFLVGYSVNCKAFRVFNSRTRIVQETLHINFLENKPNVASIRPKWLFDIDTITMSMNYQPVVTRNQPNDNAGIKENLVACKFRKKIVSAQQYMLLPLWSSDSQDPKNTDDVVVDDAFEVKENENDVHVSENDSDKTDKKKHDEKAKRDDKGKNLPELEDIIYSDDEEEVGAEADLSNLETNIPISHILTIRVHKDHLVYQIISLTPLFVKKTLCHNLDVSSKHS
nr:ribonuclease H-like domain-containing protein [Tanacetum cinerariifolium]